ncbi:hypothetical protein GGR55DRAFT_598463 [Xylaria sp. FL0064]|nr:hypothetical protein GGR55DRAFT_598463 [Xylaria sp. FL0064]
MSSNNPDPAGDEGRSRGAPNINGTRSHTNGGRALTNGGHVLTNGGHVSTNSLYIPNPERLDNCEDDDDESRDGDLPYANGGHGEIDGMDEDMDIDDGPSYYVVPDVERTRIIAEIRNLYVIQRVPLWTKDAMQDLARQIDVHRDVLAVRGLDGTMRDIPFYGGENNSDGHIIPGAKPTIQYHSIEDLLYGDLRTWDPSCAYLTMTVTWNYYSTQDPHYSNILGPLNAAILDVVESVMLEKQAWETRPLYGQMQTLVRSYPAFARVKKIVGIALGGLVYGLNYEEHEEDQEDAVARSVVQYAFMLVLRDLIAELPDFNPLNGPRCIVQDPALGHVDKEALLHLGMEVLENPYGLVELDGKSFLVTVQPEFPVKQIVAEIARPIGMI